MKRILGSLLFAVFILAAPISAYANTQAYILDENGWDRIPIPLTYEVVDVFKNLGEAGFLNHAEDIHIDQWDNIYIADTENNRIVKMDTEGTVLEIIKEADGMTLKNPKGVFADDNGVVWIADSGNQRIVTLYPDGSDRKTYVKPNSTLLDEGFTFEPARIWVNNAGYIYILRGTHLFYIDENNNFKGFIGAKEVGFNLTRTLIRMFGTQSQKDRTLKQAPDSYSSFVVGSDGMIYGALSNSPDNQLRRLTTIQGKNTYPKGYYGEYSNMSGTFAMPSISDIHVSDYGIITIVDQNAGRIYQYDQEGNLIMAFGDLGDYKGTFSIAIGLDFDSQGNLYVLDYNANSIQVFRPTEFLKSIHEAVNLHNDGKYDEALTYWEKVLGIHSNYALAHQGIAKVKYKEREWKSSMDHYLQASDKKGYSKAFSQYRHQLFRDNFLLVILAVAVIAGLLYKSYLWLKHKSDALSFNITMKKGAVFK